MERSNNLIASFRPLFEVIIYKCFDLPDFVWISIALIESFLQVKSFSDLRKVAMEEETLLQWKDVSKYTKMSETCIRAWIKKGRFPEGKVVNKRICWDLKTIDHWLKNEQPTIKQAMNENHKLHRHKIKSGYFRS